MLLKKEKLTKYWSQMAKYILPFLKGRNVTLEHVFDGKVVYRRYQAKGKKQNIRISTEKELLQFAGRYVYSFHPYIYSSETQTGWFVLDIDDKNDNFEIVKKVAYQLAKDLRKEGCNFLVKFCGKDGFHFLFAWEDKISEEKCYKIGKDFAYELALRVYRDMRREINIDFSAANQQDFIGDESLPTIIFDTKILHEHGNIRSPFSVHTSTALVSVPVKPDKLTDFDKSDAEIVQVLDEDWKWVKLPKNNF